MRAGAANRRPKNRKRSAPMGKIAPEYKRTACRLHRRLASCRPAAGPRFSRVFFLSALRASASREKRARGFDCAASAVNRSSPVRRHRQPFACGPRREIEPSEARDTRLRSGVLSPVFPGDRQQVGEHAILPVILRRIPIKKCVTANAKRSVGTLPLLVVTPDVRFRSDRDRKRELPFIMRATQQARMVSDDEHDDRHFTVATCCAYKGGVAFHSRIKIYSQRG